MTSTKPVAPDVVLSSGDIQGTSMLSRRRPKVISVNEKSEFNDRGLFKLVLERTEDMQVFSIVLSLIKGKKSPHLIATSSDTGLGSSSSGSSSRVQTVRFLLSFLCHSGSGAYLPLGARTTGTVFDSEPQEPCLIVNHKMMPSTTINPHLPRLECWCITKWCCV